MRHLSKQRGKAGEKTQCQMKMSKCFIFIILKKRNIFHCSKHYLNDNIFFSFPSYILCRFFIPQLNYIRFQNLCLCLNSLMKACELDLSSFFFSWQYVKIKQSQKLVPISVWREKGIKKLKAALNHKLKYFVIDF